MNCGLQTENMTSEARERLMRAALVLFTERGYAATSVRELCAIAGVSKPVLYYYFGSKEGLYLQLMHESYALMELVLARLTRFEGHAAERLIHFCCGIYDTAVGIKDTVRLMFSIYFGPPQGAPHYDLERFYDRILEVLDGIILEGVERGEVRPGNSSDMQWVILSCLNASIEEMLCEVKPRIDRTFIQRMVMMLFSGIGAKSTERS
ncbi:MAG TPA: TetR/AcrR family transcriptional regulator [Deltaproteobacteria bacterium]|nr:TetR/AcrR family transcriptional regulator [Deltaproteobacteria bacterium]